MKNFIVHLMRLAAATILLMVIWMFSLQISEMILPSNLKVPETPENIFFIRFLYVCLINTSVLYLTVIYSGWKGIKLSVVIFILIFGVQYFMSMIEALWFNDSLEMPLTGIFSILISGFILAIIYSPLLVWICGRFRKSVRSPQPDIRLSIPAYILRIAFLILITYPFLYFLAGYYIAWQSEQVRVFYTGSTEMQTFSSMLIENITNGLYFFQIIRGALWVMIALPVVRMLSVHFLWKGVILGLLFALLMNAQHLLPNPYFPSDVSMVHFIETASSNFIWGLVIVLILRWKPGGTPATSKQYVYPF